MITNGLFQRQLYGQRGWNRPHHNQVRSLVLNELSTSQKLEFDFGEVRDERVIPLALAFSNNPRDQKLAVAVEDGGVTILRTVDEDGSTKATKQHHFMAHNNAVFDAVWISDDTGLLTCSGDHTVRFWDASTFRYVATFGGHRSSVKSIRQFNNSPCLFVTASRDGCIRLWDIREPPLSKEDGGLNGPAGEPCISAKSTLHHIHVHSYTGRKRARYKLSAKDIPHSVTSCLVANDDKLIVTSGAMDGEIKFWDVRTAFSKKQGDTRRVAQAQPVHSILNPNSSHSHKRYGVTSLSFDPSGTLLLASYCNSDLQVYKWTHTAQDGTGSGTMTYKFPRSTSGSTPLDGAGCDSFYIKASFSPDGRYIASGSSDNRAYIWETNGSGEAFAMLKGHQQEVSTVKWSNSELPELATASDDGSVKLWSLGQMNKRQGWSSGECGSINSPQILDSHQKPNMNMGVVTNYIPPRKQFPYRPIDHDAQESVSKENIPSNSTPHKDLTSYFSRKPKPRSPPKRTLFDFYANSGTGSKRKLG